MGLKALEFDGYLPVAERIGAVISKLFEARKRVESRESMRQRVFAGGVAEVG